MKQISIVLALSIVFVTGCVGTDTEPDPVDDPAPCDPTVGDGGASLRQPLCIPLSRELYGVYYKYCSDWGAGHPVAAMCGEAPPASQCISFDSFQKYDGLHCCCDPGSDSQCTILR